MLSALVSILLIPPVNLALLTLAAMALAWRRLAALLLVLLLALAMPEVADSLLVALERDLPAASDLHPQAIVILGGDVVPVGPDPATQDIGALPLERLRGGAALHRASGLPVLTTGGMLDNGDTAVASLMARSLQTDFAVPVRWVEPAAMTTWENAQRSAELLRRDGIDTVYVVTHAWHMRRALIAFAQAGLVAVPAPLAADRQPDGRLIDFLPQASDWRRSFLALHEWIGCAWYAWRRAHG